MIDCHIHTTQSDGESTLESIIFKCNEMNCEIFAITDHDIMVGLKDIQIPNGCYFLYGVEITSVYSGREIHILAYFKDMPHDNFEKFLKNNRILSAVLLNRCQRGKKGDCTNTIPTILDKVHEYGGITIIAHPINYVDILDDIIDLCDGIELVYPSHTVEFIQQLIGKYKDRCKFFSAGSDFHGKCLVKNEKIDEDTKEYAKYLGTFIDYCKIAPDQ